MGLSYGVNEKFSLKVVLPYKQIRANTQLGLHRVEIENQSLGDTIAMGRYVVLPMKDYGFQLSLGGGVKLPTGTFALRSGVYLVCA